MKAVVIASCVILVFSVLAFGQVPAVPIGVEFQVNSYTTDPQSWPAVGVDPNGDFVVVWDSLGSSGTDAAGYSIQGQRYASDGSPEGDEFQINSYTTGWQARPAVAVAPAGDFVVVWRSTGSNGSDDSSYSVQAQRIAADGTPAGDPFQVNSFTIQKQDYPAIGTDAAGDFVVVWRSRGSSGSDSSVYSIQGQRYAADGTPAGGEFQVNSYTTDAQAYPAIGLDAVGDFVVVWESVGPDGSGFSIQGQRYGSDGTPQGDEFQVNSYTTDNQRRPAVAVNKTTGKFVAVWESGGIRGQRFASDGTPEGDEFQVHSYPTGAKHWPDVAVDPDGDFLVVWQSEGSNGTDDSVTSIQGQRYASDGTPIGGEFQVNTFTFAGQYVPVAAFDSDGDFVVVWFSVTNATDPILCIEAQRFGLDTDEDGEADAVDSCTDTDGDGYGDPGFPANTCPDDTCPGFDDNPDGDADGIPDGCDLCPGFDDHQDADNDGLPDGCDLCHGDDATGDGDADGVCADTDCDDGNPGVAYVDECGVCGGDDSSCEIFSDGFESGDTNVWSAAAP